MPRRPSTPITSALRDIRTALRSLTRNKGYAAAFVLTLGLAIGVNSAVFSVVNGVLLKPLPFNDADRILYVQQPATKAGVANANFSFLEVDDYRRQVSAFDQVVEFGDWTFSVVPGGGVEPHRAIGGLVTANYFGVLGMRAALGRALTEADDAQGAEPVMVLTHAYWTRAFGGDPDVLGSTVELSGKPTRIVGVLQPGTHYTGSRRQDFYVNYTTNDHYQSATMEDERTHRMTDVFARLAPGATLEGARAEVETVASRLHASYPEAYPETLGLGITVTRWQDELTRQARPVFLLLMGTVVAVLVLACANLANLTLTRLVGREGELATRGALGATPGALRRGLMLENLVLAVGGAAVGLVLALASRGALTAYASRFTVRAEEVSIDATVFLFTLAVGTGVAVLLAFLPGMPVAPRPGASASGGRTTGSRARKRAQRALVVTQLSLSFALLAGAGLLVRSLLNLQAVDPGYETENILTMEAFRSFASTAAAIDPADFVEQLTHRVGAFPGVRAVGVAGWAPLTGGNAFGWHFRIEGGSDEPGTSTMATLNNVTPGYFDVLKPRLLAGRYITHRDRADTDSVVVVSEAFVRSQLGGEDALGRRVSWSFNARNWSPWRRVVGVVADGRVQGLGEEPVPAVYIPAHQSGFGQTLLIATSGEPGPLAAAVIEAVHELDPTRPVDRIRTVDDLMAEDVAPARLNATLFGAFALLALAIAAVGVLGVFAFSVSQRTREFGVRIAVGADPARVLRTVLGEGVGMILGSLLLGGVAAFLGARLLAGLLYGVEPLDPAAFAVAGLALGAVALLAAFFPAHRATRIDPMEALRAE